MKPIKFDLPLNGMRVATLDQLEENLTPEILQHFRSGKLAKWLRGRSLDEQANALEALWAADEAAEFERHVRLFKSVCELFVSELDEAEARAAIQAEWDGQNAGIKKQPQLQQSGAEELAQERDTPPFEEYSAAIKEIDKDEEDIWQLKSEILDLKSRIDALEKANKTSIPAASNLPPSKRGWRMITNGISKDTE